MNALKLVLISSFLFISGCFSGSINTSVSGVPDNAYLAGKDSDVGVILCHGRAAYPTWMVVDPLRKGINTALGYHTLSIQMPAGDVDWDAYGKYFPDAYKRIHASIKALKAIGVKKIYLMGHSMGSRMATSFLASYPDSGVDGFIGVGVRSNGGPVLNSNANLEKINIPVIDVFGDGGDKKDWWDAKDRASMVSDRYQQVLISGANHVFSMHEDDMVAVVVKWLRARENQERAREKV